MKQSKLYKNRNKSTVQLINYITYIKFINIKFEKGESVISYYFIQTNLITVLYKKNMNKKNIGATLALYPCPTIVVGAFVDEKPTWTLVAHAGTVAHSHLMVSLVKAHYINKGINADKKLSINIVDESWLKDADKMGVISGNKEDKSGCFRWTKGENGAPIIDDAKVSIECEMDFNYELENFDNFICKILATYVDENYLNDQGKIDYNKFKPVLFEFPTYEYFVVGDKVGNCGRMN